MKGPNTYYHIYLLIDHDAPTSFVDARRVYKSKECCYFKTTFLNYYSDVNKENTGPKNSEGHNYGHKKLIKHFYDKQI